ncbi:MAG: DUF4252 domain-containing protein [Bacteroidota bacterium]
MKRIQLFITAAFVLCCGLSVQAQNNAIDRYFDQYANDETFTKVSISSKMFNLFTNFDLENEEDQKVIESISKLKGLKMLVANEYPEAEQTYRQAIQLPQSRMEELMTVESKEKELKFFITEENGKIAELLMLSYEKDHMIIMSLVGDIDLKELSSLSSKMDIQGFDQLDKLNEK